MTRDDLNELHALAASISAERRGWRAHRRTRAEEVARQRAEAELLAPGKRRRRHRWIAAAAAVLIVIVGAVMLVQDRAAPPAPKPKRTNVEVRHLPVPVRVGQAAALQLTDQGTAPNLFACEGLYMSRHMGSTPGQEGAAWRADYLNACLNAPLPSSTSG